MKKRLSILLLIMALLTTGAQAQLKLGIKGGLNISKADFSGFENTFKSENMNGFFIGPMLDLHIPIIGLGLDGSLLYSQRGTKFTSIATNMSITNKQHALEIPINLKYQIGLGNMASIFFAAGPSFSFNIKGDNIGDDLLALVNLPHDNSSIIDRKGAEVAVNFGGGVKLLNHLQLGINYSLPLTNTAKDNFANGNVIGEIGNVLTGKSFSSKTKMWQVSVAYLF